MRIWLMLILAIAPWCSVRAAEEAEIELQHRQMLYPVVRVSSGSAAGSGTVLYSEDRGDGCQTYVLTNHHVVEAAIQIKEEWSSLLQAMVKREFNDEVRVELFRYAEGSRQDVTDSYQAEIAAHDKNHDLALVKLKTNRKLDHVARLLPENVMVRIFQPIWAVGCSPAHPPIGTTGHINYLDEVIDRKVYWMGSANIIYGNSGGAVYLKHGGDYWFIGVPSRVAVTWGQAVTHMGFFVPIPRVRQWCADEHLTFLTAPNVKPGECFAKREERRKAAEMRLLFEKEKK